VSSDIWEVLGIAATGDEVAIRRAYAVQLKQTRPDDNPAGFARLRDAYEAALRIAKSPAAGPAAAATGREAEDRNTPRAENLPAAAAPSLPDPIARVAEALRNGDVEQAGGLLLAARGDDLMPILPWIQLSDQLAARLAQDPAIGETVVADIAEQFGWLNQASQSKTKWVRAVQARVAAARWVADVRRKAMSLTRFCGNETAAACALVAGHGSLGVSWLMPPYAQLAAAADGIACAGPMG
jgi:hypothetical protein